MLYEATNKQTHKFMRNKQTIAHKPIRSHTALTLQCVSMTCFVRKQDQRLGLV